MDTLPAGFLLKELWQDESNYWNVEYVGQGFGATGDGVDIPLHNMKTKMSLGSSGLWKLGAGQSAPRKCDVGVEMVEVERK